MSQYYFLCLPAKARYVEAFLAKPGFLNTRFEAIAKPLMLVFFRYLATTFAR